MLSPMGSMDLAGMRRKALLVGGIALAVSAAGFTPNPEQFYRSYLLAYLYLAAFPTGFLALLMQGAQADETIKLGRAAAKR